MIVNRELAQSGGHKNSDLWATPDHIFQKLDTEFHFTLDPCCTSETAKCSKFYTPAEDGLIQDWSGHRVFVNPPYSRGNIDQWMKKCWEERSIYKPDKMPAEIVALIPVSTSADWWHKYVINNCEIRFVNKRIRFVGAPYTAPFSSAIVIFGGKGVKSFNQ